MFEPAWSGLQVTSAAPARRRLVAIHQGGQINVYQMCKIGKLSYVAVAELPKRYLVG